MGDLTPRQRTLFADGDRPSYTAFLLYLYSNWSEGELVPFKWLPAGKMSLDTVDAVLHTVFKIEKGTIDVSGQDVSAMIESSGLLRELASGRMGTSNPKFLSEIIAPESTPHLAIDIWWFDGPPPPDGPVILHQMHTHVQSQFVRNYR